MWAPYYDGLMCLITLGRERALREMTVDLAQVQPGDKVLEVGSGTGTLTLTAQARVGQSGVAYGIDAAPEMIAVARRKAERAKSPVNFQVGQIACIPFHDDEFDVVLCSFMIFHMPGDTRRKGLVEMRCGDRDWPDHFSDGFVRAWTSKKGIARSRFAKAFKLSRSPGYTDSSGPAYANIRNSFASAMM